MILLIIIIVIIIAFLNLRNYEFLFASPPKCPTGFKKQGNQCVPIKPSGSNQNCNSNQILQNGKCVPKPGGSQNCKSNQILQNGKCVPKPSGSGGAPPKPIDSGNSILPSAPQQQKPTSCTFGGKTIKSCLLQYYNGDKNFIVTNKGKTLQARVNQSSYDGSKDDKSKKRHRNEIALRNVVKKDGQTISFDFAAQGAQNLDKNKSVVFFQLKPEGHGGNDAQIRLGVKSDGTIGYGLFGNEIQSTGIQASQNNNIQIKANNGRGYLYINGQQIKNNNGEPVSFSLGAANSTQIKFGLEATPNQIDGDVTGIYNNIDF